MKRCRDAIVLNANWRDNPFFPSVLEQERQDCLRITPDQYDHVWEGGYASVISGAYYAKVLTEAKNDRRIGRVSADPLLPKRLLVRLLRCVGQAALANLSARIVGRLARNIAQRK